MAKLGLKFIFSFLFILISSNVKAVEEVVFVFTPESVKFLSNEPLHSSYLGDIFSSILSYTIRSNIEWNSLAEVTPWKSPEAVVVVEVEGFSREVDIPLHGEKFMLENKGDFEMQYELVAKRTNDRYFGKRFITLHMDLGSEMHEPKISQPYLLKSIPASPEKRLQLALDDPELGELVKQSIFNISIPADAKFLTELATLKEFLKALSLRKSEVKDGIPDIYWLKITGLDSIITLYGTESVQFQEAMRLLRQMISEIERSMRNIYDDNAVIAVIKTNNVPLSLGRQARKLLQSADVTENIYNRADATDEMFSVMFIMFVFIGLLLTLSILGISVALWNMDPGRDSMVYRMTNVRMKKD